MLFPCHICGEEKGWRDYKNISHFSAYKKKRLQWCRDCQKMYVNMKRDKELRSEVRKQKVNYLVSF